MKERLIRNLDLKILAIVFAVILWLVVVNIDDPVKDDQFTGVKVQILHSEELEKDGKCYEVLDNSDEVTVSISGRRSVIEEISKDNITATADLRDLSSMNTLPIQVSSNKSGNDLVSISAGKSTVKLNIEDLEKKTKRIQVETVGEPAEGYIVGNRVLNLNQVEISGPESLVEKVENAKITLDVEGVSSSISASAPIWLYDADGNRIESSRINMNITTVSVTQEIQFSKEVEVNYIFTGMPEKGFAMTQNPVTEYSTVEICGRKNIVDGVSKIYVRDDSLNVDEQRSNVTVTVDLNNYLPVGVELADKSFDGKAEVTAVIRRENTITITQNINNIKKDGLPAGKVAEVLDDDTFVKGNTFSVKVTGLSEYLGQVDQDALEISLDFAGYMDQNDLTELPVGVYHMYPVINLPEGVHLEESCVINVRVSDK